jgi:hypothetical protein
MTTFYVASWGNDGDPGTWEQPFLTLAMAFTATSSGDIIQIGMGGDALILPTLDLTWDVTIVGNGRGDDSTIRLQGNVFRVRAGKALTLRRMVFSDEAVAQPGIVVDTGGILETYRASFRMKANTAIQSIDGYLFLDQSTIVSSSYPSFAPFPAISAQAISILPGSVQLRNSIIAGFSIGLQREVAVPISLEANDWWCAVPVAVGPMGDYDLAADPLILSVAAAVSTTPGINLSLSPSSPCVNIGADLGETDYSGIAPDLGAWETVFELPVLYCSFYNILFFLWVIASGLSEVKDALLQTQQNRALSTCDSPTMRDKYGLMAGVYRPSIFTADQFRVFLQVLYEQYTLLPAQTAFDHIVASLFSTLVPPNEIVYRELDYFDQRRWRLDLNIRVKRPPSPSLILTWDEEWFYRDRQWWRSAPTDFTVTDDAVTWIYSDGTIDGDGFVVWQKVSVGSLDVTPFDDAMPQDAYIQAVVVAAGGDITDIRHCGYLGVDSFANALSEIWNAGQIDINAPGLHILPPSEGELALLLKQVAPRILSAHKLYYLKLTAEASAPASPFYWKVARN